MLFLFFGHSMIMISQKSRHLQNKSFFAQVARATVLFDFITIIFVDIHTHLLLSA